MKILQKHLELARKNNPPFLYLYLSSHGDLPLRYWIANEKDEDKKSELKEEKEKYPFFDQYYLVFASLPTGKTMHKKGWLELVDDKKAEPHEIGLSAGHLRQMLAKWPTKTPKIVALQGCFSGGFLEAYHEDLRRSSLTGLQNITVLTASDSARTSFGCNIGNEETNFGQAFNDILSDTHPAHSGKPNTLNWKSFFQRLKARITIMETDSKIYQYASIPLFYSSSEGRIIRTLEAD